MEERRTGNFDILKCFSILLASWLTKSAYAQTKPAKPLVSAIYIFGDSVVDPGNNNGFVTIAKANFRPYGIDFVDQKSTGRFTDGRVATDILSGLVGLPDILPGYLDPQFHGPQILTGASFASGGAGYSDNTSVGLTKPAKPLVSAIYIFGDSVVDPGNNNGFVTLAKANFRPYGIDFVDQKSTGRFTDGRVATDILSGLVGLPDILPGYLDPQFHGPQILTGASFASGGAGYSDNTSNILNLRQQVDKFREYRSKLENMIGPKNASKIISGGLFAICMGTNDFINNYYFNPNTRAQYTLTQFQDLLLSSLSKFIENIYNEGATKIFIFGLPPFGCAPSQITVHNLTGNACFEEYNDVAVSFNNKTVPFLKTIKRRFPGLTLGYIGIYNKLLDKIKNPSKYGFEEVRRGCCGTGLLETVILCNPETPICPDRSKYVFWDSFHPTTTACTILAQEAFSQIVELLS